MASYTLLWTNETWDKYANLKRASGACPIEYVAGDNKKPLSTVSPGDEIFIVTVKQGSLYVGGRLIVASYPLNRRDAVSQLGRNDLIDKELFFIADDDLIDEFRPACLVELNIAKNLELIRVDGTICRPSLDKKGSIDRQAFRTPFKLPVKSAETLRLILDGSVSTLRHGETKGKGAAKPEALVHSSHDGDTSSIVGSNSFSNNQPAVKVNHAEPESSYAEITKEIEEECANLEGQDVDAVVKRRLGQGVFRDLLLERFDGACCMTGLINRRLLIASHIVPWSKSTPTQKLDPENGLLLSVSMDALFDKGLISFSNSGSILISNDLDTHATGILGLRSDFALPPELLTDKRKSNLAIHRELHGFVRSL